MLDGAQCNWYLVWHCCDQEEEDDALDQLFGGEGWWLGSQKTKDERRGDVAIIVTNTVNTLHSFTCPEATNLL